MTLKLILWDIGGVLMRTEDPAPREQLAAELGITRAELEKAVFGGEMGTRAQRGEIHPDELWEHIRRQFGLTRQQIDEFRRRFWAGDRLDHELVAAIRKLRAAGYLTGVLSNAWGDLRTTLRDEWQIADAFDFITASAEEGVMKPDERIYHIALARAGVEPAEAVFIDDFPHNIAGAQAVGMHGILFQSRAQALRDLENLLQT